MAADSRSTHTDALASLGTIISANEHRDAIHLGVEPVIADDFLSPGDHVGFTPDGKASCNPKYKPVGIVDPFLTKAVKKGERFWLIVYPRQITSLRHVWEHPDFPNSMETGTYMAVPAPTEEQLHRTNLLLGEEKAVAKEVILQCARALDVTYDELLERTKDYLEHGEYWVEGDKFDGENIPDSFWPAYETITGTKVDPDNKYSFLSCSC